MSSTLSPAEAKELIRIELLLRHEESQQVKNDALQLALLLDRHSFIELAVVHGAEIASVPFLDVLLTGNRAVVVSFLERGADPIADYPFAHAFTNCAPRPCLGLTWTADVSGLTSQNTCRHRSTWHCASSAMRAASDLG